MDGKVIHYVITLIWIGLCLPSERDADQPQGNHAAQQLFFLIWSQANPVSFLLKIDQLRLLTKPTLYLKQQPLMQNQDEDSSR